MMRFKCNKCSTLIWSLVLSFTSFLPGLIVLTLVNPNNGIMDFNDLIMFYIFLFFLIIFINITSFFFNTDIIEVYDDYFRYKDIEIEYSKIYKVSYDFGETPRHTKWKSCSINFYDENEDLFCFIDNPSFRMCLVLLKKCKHAKFKLLFNNSYFIIMGVGIIIGLCHYFFK